jgi:hypothetical protein
VITSLREDLIVGDALRVLADTNNPGHRRPGVIATYRYIEPPNTATANRPTYDKPTDRVATGPIQGTGKGTRGGSKDVSDIITSLRLKGVRVEQNGTGNWSAHRNGKSVTFASTPSDPNWKQIVVQDLKKHLGIDLRG